MRKIMIIDDNEADLFYDEIMLKEQISEVEIATAYDGEEALEKLSSGYVPNLILLDINMPRMNGHEFLEAYAEQNTREAPVVVMLTTSYQEADIAKAMQYKCVKHCLSKPLTEETVKDIERIAKEG